MKIEHSDDGGKSSTELIRTTRNLVAVLTVLVVLMFGLVIRMQIQVDAQNRELHKLETTANDAKSATMEASDSLADIIESRRLSDADVASATKTIISIFRLLCEQFPSATPCIGDG